MKNKDFDSMDKFAQDAFENFEVDFDSMDWMDMQSKLRAESSIDRVAKDSLKDYEVPFNEQHWQEFEKQLNKKDRIYPHIWWMKGTEVSIMATLLLFTMFNFNTNKTNTNTTSTYGNTTTLIPSSSTDANQEKTYQMNSEETTEQVKPQALLNTEAQEDLSSINASSAKPLADAKSLQNDAATNRSYQDANGQENANNNQDHHMSALAAADNGSEVPNQPTNNGSGEDGTTNNSAVATASHSNNSSVASNHATGIENSVASKDGELGDVADQKRNQFSILKIPVIELKDGIKHTDPAFELKKLKLKIPYQCKTYIGGVASISANLATSMGGTSIGYGAGITFDTEFSSRIALKSALLVSYKKYENNETFERPSVDGNVYEISKSQTSNLVLVEIPLDVQFTFFRNEKWKIYATAGVSANMVGSRTYVGHEKTNYQGLAISTAINSNDYERGMLEQGSFTQNAFLSVGGGLGLERQLGDKISLYLLPSYRHAVTPAGADYIHSFNFSIGIKSSL